MAFHLSFGKLSLEKPIFLPLGDNTGDKEMILYICKEAFNPLVAHFLNLTT